MFTKPIGLYAVQGRLHITQYRLRIKQATASVSSDDLLTSIENFKIDISLNGGSHESWYSLAQLYNWLADDMLSWSAETIEREHKTIGNYQKNAYYAILWL